MTSSTSAQQDQQEKLRPLREGLFEMPDRLGGPVVLTGNRCQDCGEPFFPARHYCAACTSSNLTPETFGPRGTVHTFTIVRQQLPGAAVKAPYAIVTVRMEGGVTAQSVLVDVDAEDATIGEPVETTARSVQTDEDGGTVVNYFFRPLEKKEG